MQGKLDINKVKGEINFYSREGKHLFRITDLPKPIPKEIEFIDITYGSGVNYSKAIKEID